MLRKGRIRLRAEAHLSKFLSTAALSLYVLGTLRSHGVTSRPHHDLDKATDIIAQTMYSSTAWRGHSNRKDLDQLDRFLGIKLRRSFLTKATNELAIKIIRLGD